MTLLCKLIGHNYTRPGIGKTVEYVSPFCFRCGPDRMKGGAGK